MGGILDNPQFRERRFVFSDRQDAGKKLGASSSGHIWNTLIRWWLPSRQAGFLSERRLHWRSAHRLSSAIVRKIQIPGNTEAGFGAITWDGQVLINERLRAALGLSQA